ncbi:hypothetical protein DTL21_20710 [Bremerella cremea]|uniref:Carboxypeptidase regulatory-like domain-containing protein n=1 Tax=Blastopirellula marina TaxID=124 RepID=A0A2S8FKD7_9BACT|nr:MULTISPECIES: hypothetical protein [Pirellulaceae]PQO32626.1 hypothetical protein C5Y83_20690 [Blastopirellula marina]RCS45693.1 hypothetical protein DTL21_20710 [Bremerella cremea]
MYRALGLLAVFALIPMVGCGGQTGNEVIATVNYEDGSPVPQGTVRFVSDSYETFGNIVDGKVNIGDMDGGVPNGTYKVAVQATEQGGESGGTYGTPIVAKKFGNPNTSGIEIKVEENKDIEIVVGKKP